VPPQPAHLPPSGLSGLSDLDYPESFERYLSLGQAPFDLQSYVYSIQPQPNVQPGTNDQPRNILNPQLGQLERGSQMTEQLQSRTPYDRNKRVRVWLEAQQSEGGSGNFSHTSRQISEECYTLRQPRGPLQIYNSQIQHSSGGRRYFSHGPPQMSEQYSALFQPRGPPSQINHAQIRQSSDQGGNHSFRDGRSFSGHDTQFSQRRGQPDSNRLPSHALNPHINHQQEVSQMSEYQLAHQPQSRSQLPRQAMSRLEPQTLVQQPSGGDRSFSQPPLQANGEQYPSFQSSTGPSRHFQHPNPQQPTWEGVRAQRQQLTDARANQSSSENPVSMVLRGGGWRDDGYSNSDCSMP